MNVIEPTAEAFRRVQRRALKKLGKTILRATDESLASTSWLGDGPLYDPLIFPWVPALEAAAGGIRSELEHLLAHREQLPTFQDISPAQQRISDDERWRVFAFYGFGERSAQNCGLCPITARTLDGIPGVYNAFFSILAPDKHIPRHHGVTRGFIRCHLGLIVPAQRERCRMDVDGSLVCWEEGKAVLFDDSRPHEVWNETNETRAVLLFDVPRPMTVRGRALLALLMGVLERTHYVKDVLANQRRWEDSAGGIFTRRPGVFVDEQQLAVRGTSASADRDAWRC